MPYAPPGGRAGTCDGAGALRYESAEARGDHDPSMTMIGFDGLHFASRTGALSVRRSRAERFLPAAGRHRPRRAPTARC